LEGEQVAERTLTGKESAERGSPAGNCRLRGKQKDAPATLLDRKGNDNVIPVDLMPLGRCICHGELPPDLLLVSNDGGGLAPGRWIHDILGA